MIPHLLIHLANAMTDSVSGEFALKLVAGIFTGLGILFTAVWAAYKKGLAGAVTISNQPLQIKLEEQFVTRREFDRLETAINRDVVEMKGLFNLTMQKLGDQNAHLTQKIERQGERLSEQVIAVSKGAYEGRKGIHQKLNHQGEQIAALEAKGDVARELGKFGTALTKALKED